MKDSLTHNKLNNLLLSTGFFISVNLLSFDLFAQNIEKESNKPSSSKSLIVSKKIIRTGSKKKKDLPSLTLKNATHFPFNLQKVITAALTNHPNLQADRAAQREALYRTEQAKSGFWPSLDAQGSGGWGYLRDKLTANKLNGSATGTIVSDRYEGSLTLKQMIFDGLDTSRKVEKAKKEEVQSLKKISETKELIAFQAGREYYTIIRFRELIKLAEENIRNHENILGKVRALVQGGRGSIADIEHVEARVADARSALQDIKEQLGSSEARFIEVVGHEPGLLSADGVATHLLPTHLNNALEMACKMNRSLEVANATVEVAKADLASTDTAFYPTIGAEVTAQKSFNGPGENGNQTNMSALAVMRYNLFNGGKDIARKREYIERLTEAKYKREAEKRRTEREVRISFDEMMSARTQVANYGQTMTTKKQLLNTYLAQFDRGDISFLQIVDASHDWFLAKGASITARVAADIAALRLLATVGKLTETYESSASHRVKNSTSSISEK